MARKNGPLCEYHKCPVPNCNFKRFNQNIQFCNYHLCYLCARYNKTLKGVDLACPSSQLCTEHRCLYSSSCQNQKLNNLTKSCVEHSCKECIASKSSIINPVEDKTRKTCSIHKLCNFVNMRGKLCSKIVLRSSLYCREHQERRAQTIVQISSKRCSGIFSKDRPCRSNQVFFKRGDQSYCDNHRPKDAIMEMSDSSDDDENETANDYKMPQRIFNPVLRVQKSVNYFKQIKCNDEKCRIVTFCQIELSVWICPIHEKRPEIPKVKEEEEEEEEEVVQPKLATPAIAQQVKETNKVQIESSSVAQNTKKESVEKSKNEKSCK